jgi:DNA-binding NarL/FixJ family response regulator
VDDSRDVVDAMTELLEQTGKFKVVGTATSEATALDWLFQNERGWDVAVVDLLLQDGSGFNILGHCQKYHPGKVVVFSEFASPAIAERCRKFGAVAAFPKSRLPEFLDFLASLEASHA